MTMFGHYSQDVIIIKTTFWRYVQAMCNPFLHNYIWIVFGTSTLLGTLLYEALMLFNL
jgi:hypothetical protein